MTVAESGGRGGAMRRPTTRMDPRGDSGVRARGAGALRGCHPVRRITLPTDVEERARAGVEAEREVRATWRGR